MSKRIDLKGKKFGRLTVMDVIGNDTSGNLIWKCLCSCGVETSVSRANLKTGKTISCGCFRQEMRLEMVGVKAGAYKHGPYRSLYNEHLRSSKYRKLENSLTFEQFNDLISRNCDYCGSQPTESGRKYVKRNGIDRVDNSIGYVIENCVSCCKDCNRAKGTMSRSEFIEMIRKVYELNILYAGFKKLGG